jgi:hypothetical protein
MVCETIELLLRGKMLYHFTNCESALKIILTDDLRYSKSIDFDDPFERWRHRNYTRMPPTGVDSGPEARLYGHFNSLVNLTNVLCFFDCENEKNEIINPLENLKMWSHYGKNHTGCCLVFDKNKIINSFVEFYKNDENSVYDYGRVEYNDLKNYEHTPMISMGSKELSSMGFKKLFHNLFFNKAKYYSGENEYRFAVNNGNRGCSMYVKSKIIKVVVGENTKEVDYFSIVNLCKILNIEVGRMFVSDDKLEYAIIAAPENA